MIYSKVWNQHVFVGMGTRIIDSLIWTFKPWWLLRACQSRFQQLFMIGERTKWIPFFARLISMLLSCDCWVTFLCRLAQFQMLQGICHQRQKYENSGTVRLFCHHSTRCGRIFQDTWLLVLEPPIQFLHFTINPVIIVLISHLLGWVVNLKILTLSNGWRRDIN